MVDRLCLDLKGVIVAAKCGCRPAVFGPEGCGCRPAVVVAAKCGCRPAVIVATVFGCVSCLQRKK